MSKLRSNPPFRSLPVLALLLFARALPAQEPGPVNPVAAAQESWQRRYSATVDLLVVGTSLGGPSQDIEDAMWGAGLNDPGEGGILGTEYVSYPRTHEFPQRVARDGLLPSAVSRQGGMQKKPFDPV